MARDQPQVNLRIPAPLKDALDAAAAKNGRSLTAEIVQRLESSFNESGAGVAATRVKYEALDQAFNILATKIRQLDLIAEGDDPNVLQIPLLQMATAAEESSDALQKLELSEKKMQQALAEVRAKIESPRRKGRAPRKRYAKK